MSETITEVAADLIAKWASVGFKDVRISFAQYTKGSGEYGTGPVCMTISGYGTEDGVTLDRLIYSQPIAGKSEAQIIADLRRLCDKMYEKNRDNFPERN